MMKSEFSYLLVAMALSRSFGRTRIVGSGKMAGVSSLDGCRPGPMVLVIGEKLLLQINLLEKQLLLLEFGCLPLSFSLKC